MFKIYLNKRNSPLEGEEKVVNSATFARGCYERFILTFDLVC